MTETLRPEVILLESGGCGRFQIILAVLVHVLKASITWSMTIPIIASKTPKWWCVEDLAGQNLTLEGFELVNNVSLAERCVSLGGSKCSNFLFDTDLRTIVSEWNLVCDDSWVPSTVMSVQMGGVFAGHVISGHMADAVGRKKPFFLSFLILAVFNLVSIFSVSWVMFAVCRFLIGFGMGCFLTVQYNVMCEYALPRWRSMLVTFPSWVFEVCLFVLAAWRLRDWKSLHVIIVVMAAVSLVTWWFIPESFRWYLAHSKLTEAEKTIQRVSKINKRRAPTRAQLQQIADEEMETNRGNRERKYSVRDLIKSRSLLKLTLPLIVAWFTLGFASYGMTFGVKSWTGDIFFNMFLFYITTIPISFLSIYMMNRFGRKLTAALSFATCAGGALIVGILQYIDTNIRGQLANAFAVISHLGIAAAWGSVQTWTTEVYPTVVRNIGYGFLNIIARVGAILGPQLVYLDSRLPGIMFFICFGVAFFSLCAVVFMLPETKEAPLTDMIEEQSVALDKKQAISSKHKYELEVM